MNKKITLVYLLALTLLSLHACETEEAAPSNNKFTFNLNTYPLQRGTIRSIQTEHHPETDAQLYEWDIFLSSGSLDDKIHWVRFILNSSDPNEVPLGTYTYDPKYSMDDFTFYLASIMRNADTEETEGGAGDFYATPDFKSGKVTIEKSGDIYTVSFELSLDGVATSTGFYEGKLTLREPVISE